LSDTRTEDEHARVEVVVELASLEVCWMSGTLRYAVCESVAVRLELAV
jgi:hypothetical protein